MAHQITATDGLMLAGKPAWHGLGIVLPEAPTPTEALRVAGIDWRVVESDALTGTFGADSGEPRRVAASSHKMLCRSDNGAELSVVGIDYAPVQNAQLAELADALAGTGTAQIETAGSIRGGREVFFLARTGSLDLPGGDTMAQYVALLNSHDGTRALRIFPTSVRVVCANTVAMSLREANGAGYSLRHTSGILPRIEDIRRDLARSADDLRAIADAARTLAEVRAPISRQSVAELWLDVLQRIDGRAVPTATEAAGDKLAHRRRNAALDALANMAETFDRESSRFGASAWTAANAATQWIQHERGRMTGEARVSSRFFGERAAETREAFAAAIERFAPQLAAV